MKADITDALATLLAEKVDEDAEIEKLMTEARRAVFGKRLRPLLTLHMTLRAMLWTWQHYTEQVDRWAAQYARKVAAWNAILTKLPQGPANGARAEAKSEIADAEWRRNAARHVHYTEYPNRQIELAELLEACWRESGVTEDVIDSRIEVWNEILVNRYYYRRFNEDSLLKIAAVVATDEG